MPLDDQTRITKKKNITVLITGSFFVVLNFFNIINPAILMVVIAICVIYLIYNKLIPM